jgi:hypothetical protein
MIDAQVHKLAECSLLPAGLLMRQPWLMCASDSSGFSRAVLVHAPPWGEDGAACLVRQ